MNALAVLQPGSETSSDGKDTDILGRQSQRRLSRQMTRSISELSVVSSSRLIILTIPTLVSMLLLLCYGGKRPLALAHSTHFLLLAHGTPRHSPLHYKNPVTLIKDVVLPHFLQKHGKTQAERKRQSSRLFWHSFLPSPRLPWLSMLIICTTLLLSQMSPRDAKYSWYWSITPWHWTGLPCNEASSEDCIIIYVRDVEMREIWFTISQSHTSCSLR